MSDMRLGFGLTGGVPQPELPRGLRNNNPGNIRKSREKWQGAVPDGDDPDFVQFETPIMGIRAMSRILRNYRKLHGAVTLDEFVSRWAPPSENDTDSYIASVAQMTGLRPDTEIDVNNPEMMTRLLAAFIRQENGAQPFSPEQLLAGFEASL